MQSHDFTATYQVGIITQVNSNTHQVKCQIPALENLETAWLHFLTLNAGGNQFYCLPDIGEQAALLLDARGESGCVLGVIFNNQDKPPANDNNIWKKQFSNGTTIEHNRITGNISIQSKGKIIINNSDVEINQGNVQVNNGNIRVSGGDVIADGISLKNHTHGQVKSGSDKTSQPS